MLDTVNRLRGKSIDIRLWGSENLTIFAKGKNVFFPFHTSSAQYPNIPPASPPLVCVCVESLMRMSMQNKGWVSTKKVTYITLYFIAVFR